MLQEGWRRWDALLLGVTLGILSCAPAAPPLDPEDVAPGPPPPLEGRTLIIVGDEIGIEFFYHPELNRNVLVRPDGYISLPHAGEILAVGKTPGDLSREIADAFVDVLKERDITVVLRSLATRKVYVGGEVTSPQPVPLLPGMSISHAIFAVGGFRDTGHRETVLLIRYRPSEPAEVRTVDMAAVMEGHVADPLLQPYDVVYVPKTAIAQADQFVDQYINQIIPRSVNFLFSTFFVPVTANSN